MEVFVASNFDKLKQVYIPNLFPSSSNLSKQLLYIKFLAIFCPISSGIFFLGMTKALKVVFLLITEAKIVIYLSLNSNPEIVYSSSVS